MFLIYSYVWRSQDRYKLDPRKGSAEDFVVAVAERVFLGDREKAGQRILRDFRTEALGAFALELPLDISRTRGREQQLEGGA